MLATKPAPRNSTPPAKSWRNYYRIYRVLRLAHLGTVFPGVHAGPSAFASQDVAESHARSFVKWINPPGRWLMDHVGAFPEGDAAN